MVHSEALDGVFAALGDPTRRAVLERLGAGEATLGELAEPFAMSLTGLAKHVRVLEAAGLVTTEKVGRVRRCRLDPRPLEDASEWIERHRRTMAERLDRFGAVLDRERGRP